MRDASECNIGLFLPDYKFDWPDLKIKSELDSVAEDTKDDVDQAKELYEKSVRADTSKYRPGVPTFFGL